MQSLRTRITLVAAVSVVVVGGVIGFPDLAGRDAPPLPAGVPGETATSSEPSDAAVSPQASPVATSPVPVADISFVDLRTGRATLLPRSIRAIAGAAHFRLSPDGSMLAFDDGTDIYVSTIDGERVRTLTPGQNDGSATGPSWSPDGRRIAFSRGSAGYVVEVPTPANRGVVGPRGLDVYRPGAVVTWPKREAAANLIHDLVVRRPGHKLWRPEFSPDGTHLLFTSMSDRRRWPARLWTVPIDGGEPRRLPLPGAAFGSFSPDGASIAYRRTSYDGETWSKMTGASMWVADADGANPRSLTPTPSTWASQGDPQALWPTWSPDGTRIAYKRLFCAGVSVLDVETGRRTNIGIGVDPSWADAHTLIVVDFGEEACG